MSERKEMTDETMLQWRQGQCQKAFNGYVHAIQDVLRADRSRNVMVMLVGLSGSGKSWLVQQLRTALAPSLPSPNDLRILSMDEMRIRVNGGVYPETTQAHSRVNKRAIPMYNEALWQARERLLILDNTHLRWSPNWETPLQKAHAHRYHLLTMVPPFTRFALTENRSTHGVTPAIFLSMANNWPGFRFSPFLYRMISPDTVPSLLPLKPDPMGRFVGPHPWGPPERKGYLYLLNNYIGYMEAAMGDRAVDAAFVMEAQGAGHLFLQKEGLLHFTLVFPHHKEMKKFNYKLDGVFNRLLSHHAPPPIEYTGVHRRHQQEGTDHDDVWFLTVSEKTQTAWEAVVNDACAAMHYPGGINRTGLHITIGYTKKDDHSASKAVTPSFPFTPAMPQDIPYLPPFRGNNLPLDRPAADLVLSFLQNEASGVGITVDQLHLEEPTAKHLSFLLAHQGIKSKCRWVPSSIYNHGSLLMVAFQPASRGRADEIYQADRLVQTKLPRGLTFLFGFDKVQRSVRIVTTVYPTSKFFGDDDGKEDVDVADDATLQQLVSSKASLVITEKANGEMFSFTVVGKSTQTPHIYSIALGSKHNKFVIRFQPGLSTAEARSMATADIEAYVAADPQNLQHAPDTPWFMLLWQEMIQTFATVFSALPSAQVQSLLDTMLAKQWTACGEFESADHPHLMPFPPGHQSIRFFALTASLPNGDPQPVSGAERIAQLRFLQTHGLPTVAWRLPDRDATFLTIRHDIWMQRGVEGCVLVVDDPQQGATATLIKLKTIWYVMWRAIRERTRFVLHKKGTFDVALLRTRGYAAIDTQTPRFAALGRGEAIRQEWRRRFDRYVAYLTQIEKEKGKAGLHALLEHDYPSVIQTIEKEEEAI